MLAHHLMNPEIVEISINGKKFNAIKSIIDEFINTGNELFADRYTFEIDDITTDPERLLMDMYQQIEFNFGSGDLYEDLVRFIDKYFKNEEHINTIKQEYLRQFLIDVNKLKFIPPHIKHLYTEDTDTSIIVTGPHLRDLQNCIMTLYYIYSCKTNYKIGANSVNIMDYFSYIIYNYNKSTYMKISTMMNCIEDNKIDYNPTSYCNNYVKGLKIVMTDDLFNHIIQTIAEDYGMITPKIRFTKDWERLFDTVFPMDDVKMFEKINE